MEAVTVSGYLIEIDGEPEGVSEYLGMAKTCAMRLAKGKASIKLTSVGSMAGKVPQTAHAWYFNYVGNEWLFSHDAVHCEPKQKSE